MKKETILKKIKNKLIVSCQALKGEPLYIKGDTFMHYMAKAAKQAGSPAIRTNGILEIKKIKETTKLPVIGIIKKKYKGAEQYITVSMKEIDALVKAKTDIIALDCTLRPRYDGTTINDFIKKIKKKYPKQLLMADISTLEEGINAEKMGVDFIGTTLNGYTEYTKGNKDNFTLVKELSKKVSVPVIAEGRIYSPEDAKKMLKLGAYAVVVGGAITRPYEIAKRFIEGMK